MMKTMVLVAIGILAVSCETESLVVKNTPQQNVSANAVLKQNVLRLTQHSTAVDNLIDGTNCFSIVFPYRVLANGQEISIQSIADYQQVRSVFNSNPNDTDTVLPVFPIRVRYVDYTESDLATAMDYELAKSNCLGSAELSCMRLQFPIKMEWFDWPTQSAGKLEFKQARDLFGFIANLAPETAASFDYPLQIATPDATVSVENNENLQQVIQTYLQDCAPSEPGNPDLVFEEVLATGSWYVSYFFRESDQTGDYALYDFTFIADGTSSTTGEPAIIAGTWDTFSEDGQQHIAFVFSSGQLEELEESWIIDGFSQTTVQMRYESGGSGTRYLNLTRN